MPLRLEVTLDRKSAAIRHALLAEILGGFEGRIRVLVGSGNSSGRLGTGAGNK